MCKGEEANVYSHLVPQNLGQNLGISKQEAKIHLLLLKEEKE